MVYVRLTIIRIAIWAYALKVASVDAVKEERKHRSGLSLQSKETVDSTLDVGQIQKVLRDQIPESELASKVVSRIRMLPKWQSRLDLYNTIKAMSYIGEYGYAEGGEGYIFTSSTKPKCRKSQDKDEPVVIKIGKEKATSQYASESADVRTMCITDWVAKTTGYAAGYHAWGVDELKRTLAVMPAYEGDLVDYIHDVMVDVRWNDPDTVALLKNVVKQLADGMAALIRTNVVHTDVKPDNIFFKCAQNDPGACRFDYADFGGACHGECNNEPVIIATPGYVPPATMQEIDENRAKKEDDADDPGLGLGANVSKGLPLYALGATVFELATKKNAMEDGCTVGKDCYAYASRVPQRVSRLLSDASADPVFIDAVLSLLLGVGSTEAQKEFKDEQCRMNKQQFAKEVHEYLKQGKDSRLPACMRPLFVSRMQMPEIKYKEMPYDANAGLIGLKKLQGWANSVTPHATLETKRLRAEDLGILPGCMMADEKKQNKDMADEKKQNKGKAVASRSVASRSVASRSVASPSVDEKKQKKGMADSDCAHECGGFPEGACQHMWEVNHQNMPAMQWRGPASTRSKLKATVKAVKAMNKMKAKTSKK